MSKRSNWFEENPKKTLIVVFILQLFLIEIALKVFLGEATPDIKNYIEFNRLTFKDYVPYSKFITKPGKYDTFQPAINEINSFGIRGPELQKKRSYRVLNIGDSFIQADEVAFEDTFGEKLNRYFKGRIEFISHGISSWSPTPEFSWIYHKGIKLKIDEVNLFLFINDFLKRETYSGADGNYRDKAIYNNHNVPVSYDIEANGTLAEFKACIKKISTVMLLYRGFKTIRSKLKKTKVKSGFPLEFPKEIYLLSRDHNEWPFDLKAHVDETIYVLYDLKNFLSSRDIEFNILKNNIPENILCADCYMIDRRFGRLFCLFVKSLVMKNQDNWDVEKMQDRFDRFFLMFEERIPKEEEFLSLF